MEYTIHNTKYKKELIEDGAKITAVIERDGSVINDDGIEIEELMIHMKENGGVKGIKGYVNTI